MYNTYWTPEEDQILRDNLGKMSYKMMEEFLPNRKEAGIRQRALLRLGINNNEYIRVGNIKWFHNENFWSVPNIINSYWAGFVCADGSIGVYDKSYMFSLNLSTKDESHLQLFKDTVKFDGNLQYATHKSPSSENMVNSVKLTIGNARNWHKDLSNNFNIIPNKTLRIGPPSLWRDEFLFAFLAGYIDGDGCISKINDGRIALVLTSSSQDMLLWVQDFIDKRFPYKVGKQTLLPTSASDTCQRLGFSGYKSAMIFDYMCNLPVPKLSRKWENPAIIEAVEKYKKQKPELFNYNLLPSYENYLNFLPESVKSEEQNNMKIKKVKQTPESVQSFKQSDGQFINIKSIDRLWGKEKLKYKQETLKEYQDYLNSLTDFELENYALNFNITRFMDRETVVSQLEKLFNKDLAARNKPKSENIQVITPELNKKLKELMEI